MMSLGGLDDPRADGSRLFVELGPGGALTRLAGQTLPGITALSVSTPDDLDRLVGLLAGDTALHTFASGHQGEHLYVSERVVISPCAGIFEPATEALGPDAPVEVGSLLGTVSGTDVRSPFEGWLMGMLAQPEERVQTGQPIAWLRAR
jgi:[acyl-carrier-protein] S-malonyltransferase